MTSWRRRVAVVVAGTGVVLASMIVSGMGPDLLLVSALIATVAIGAWVLADTADAVADTAPSTAAPRSAPPPEGDRRVKQVRTGLAYGRTDGLSRERLHASLVDIVDDRLRTAHQIDRATRPDAARALLGADLAAFVEAPEPPDTLSRPRDLDRLLTRIEQL
jgi:hypothetical protein